MSLTALNKFKIPKNDFYLNIFDHFEPIFGTRSIFEVSKKDSRITDKVRVFTISCYIERLEKFKY